MKLGDTVLVIEGYGGRALCKITRETKTQWIVTRKAKTLADPYEEKYRKDDLYAVGCDIWRRSRIQEISETEANKLRNQWAIDMRKEEVVFALSKMRWENIGYEDLCVLEKILEKMNNET